MLTSCSFVNQQWGQIQGVFRRMDRDYQSIKETILIWHNNIFSSPVLNRTWGLALGFYLWTIWKEQNCRIFKNKTSTQDQVWEGLVKNIREKILAEQWSPKYFQVPPHEARILHHLNLRMEMITPNAWKTRRMNIDSLIHFILPGEGIIKLNFDGASKGNLRAVGLGGIFRDNQENTHLD